MFCTKCGSKLDDGSRFCSSCGKELGTTQLEETVQKEAYGTRDQFNSASSPNSRTQSLSPFEYYTRVFSKYGEFKGRANRREYWYYFLFYFIFLVVLSITGVIPKRDLELCVTY